MSRVMTCAVVAVAGLCAPLPAQQTSDATHTWTKTLKDGTKPGTLHSLMQMVRGDSGKWSDNARLQHTPPVPARLAKRGADEWGDQLPDKKVQLTSNDDNWLLFRTRQLNDHDRLWVARVERRRNRFTVVANQAVWQGRYSKNFTYHAVCGVNLGKLEPGKYEATWVINPQVFNRFEKPGRPQGNWPKDERPAPEKNNEKPLELSVSFTIVPAPRK